jgi:hypothetical protein
MNINDTVLSIKTKGLANAEWEFTQLFNALLTQTENAVQSYLDRRYPGVPLDRNSVLTFCQYEWLTRLITRFDESKGDFLTFFYSLLYQGISNALKSQMKQKNKINLDVVSITAAVDDDGNNLLEAIPEEKPMQDFSGWMQDALEAFAQRKGENARKVLLCFAYLDGRARTKAICKVFNECTYSPAIRKRVERIKNDFASLIHK